MRYWNIRKYKLLEVLVAQFLCCLVTTDYVDLLNHSDEFETEENMSKIIIILTSFSVL